jgi:hypothetical protein
MKSWLTDLRKLALISLIALVLGSAIPAWNSLRQLAAVAAENPGMKPWVAIATVAGIVLSAALPIFYFALFRNEGSLHFATRFRPLAMAGAISLGLFVAMEMPSVIGAFGPSSTGSVVFHGKSNLYGAAISLLAQLSNLPMILLTIAFYRRSDGEPNSCPAISRLMRITATVAVVGVGIGLAFAAIRLLASPFAYFLVRNSALQAGREPWSFAKIVGRTLPDLLVNFGLLVAPYIVYKSRSVGDPEIE